MRGTPVERFMDKVSPEPMSGCWLWTGAMFPTGYGSFALTRRGVQYAHRASLVLFRGVQLPQGRMVNVDHRCRVKLCVNPDHLELVPHVENIRRRDAVRVSKKQAPPRSNATEPITQDL